MLLKITKRSQKTPYKHKNRHLRLRFGLLVLCALFYNVNASTADTAVNLSEFCLNFRSNTSKLMRDNGTEDFVKSIEINENWRFVRQNENQRGPTRLIRLTYMIDDLTLLEINAAFFESTFRGLRGVINTGKRPEQLIDLTSNCKIREIRKIDYHNSGQINEIMLFQANGSKTTIPVNPLPPMHPPRLPKENGPVIGHIDSGVDYLRPAIIQHLGFDKNGMMIGIDAWDGDDLPYDANFTVSPFHPQHHGSFVVDVLLQTGVNFTLLPARYPRNNMNLMGDLIKWMGKNGAQIVMVPLGSKNLDDWGEFFKEAAAHPEILFIISAGNNGIDIGKTDIYPAVNNLTNALTVTSTLKNGEIANGSNYGTNVDIGLPAENLMATGVGGLKATKSGSSFAVPKLAAFATCTILREKKIFLTGARLAKKIKNDLQKSEYIGKYQNFLSDSDLIKKCEVKL